MNSANTSSVAYPASTRYTGRGDKSEEPTPGGRHRLRIPDDDHEDPDERRNAAEHEEQPLCRDHVDAEPPSRRRPHAAGDSPAWLSAGGLDLGNSPDTLHR